MAKVSIGKAWQETSEFVRREGQLLFPVSFLFIAIPFALLMQIVPPEMRRGVMTPQIASTGAATGFMLGALLTMVIASVGTLALNALALRPGISVREALELSLRRLPVMLGSSLLVGVALGVVLVMLSFVSPHLAIGVVMGAAIYCGMRLLPINAVVTEEGLGVVASLKRCWALTRGHFWRLALFVGVMILLVSFAQMVAQMLFGVVGFMIGGREVGQAAADLGVALASGVAQVYMMVMITRLYRQFAD